MKPSLIILLIAVGLILLGGGVALGALYAASFDLPLLSLTPLEEMSVTVTSPFSAIDMQTDIGNVRLSPSSDGSCRVSYTDVAAVNYEVDVVDNTLIVKRRDTRRWYEKIQFFTPPSTLTIYLPEADYATLTVNTNTGDAIVPADFAFDNVTFTSDTGDLTCTASIHGALTVTTDTGDVNIGQCTPSSLEIRTDTGDVALTKVAVAGPLSARTTTGDLSLNDCAAVTIATDTATGDQTLTNTIADDRINMKSNTGEVRLKRCDAYILEIKTNTGDVHGELLTMKNFQGATNTGHVSVPKTTEDFNGVCYAETDTGDISFSVVSDTVRRDNFD